MENTKKKKRLDKDDMILYITLMLWPVLQFTIFYVVVNFNSILLAFEKIDMSVSPSVTTFSFSYFVDNIKSFYYKVNSLGDEFVTMIKTSVYSLGIRIIVSVPLGLLFSYYIGKKFVLSGFFRVILFLPSIMSTIVIAPLFRDFVSDALPIILHNVLGTDMNNKDFILNNLLYNENTNVVFGAIMFYNIWIGFGTTVLMYSNVVSEVSPDIIEAAKIDGVNASQEFLHIIMPSVYPTMTVFIVTEIAGIFTLQWSLMDFFGGNSSVINVGYILYILTQTSGQNIADYPALSAFALVLTAVVIPLTMIVRFAMEKLGPSED